MSVLPYLIILVLLGLAVGWLAPRLLGGSSPAGGERTAVVGVGAAFIAGVFCWYVLNRHGFGLVISVAFSMVVVWLYSRSQMASYRSTPPPRYRTTGPPRGRPAPSRARTTAPPRGRPAPPRGRRPPY